MEKIANRNELNEVSQIFNYYNISNTMKELWDINSVIKNSFKPHAIQRTQKESILSVYKKMHIRLKSKQNTIEGYVK